MVEHETKAVIQTLRIYRGSEFKSHEFETYCESTGIRRHLTAPYSPQHNGVVERRNRTLLEMTMSILKHMNVPKFLWGEAVQHATYLINRLATRSLKGKTPYEALRSKKPNLNHLRVFGCVCYAITDEVGRKKLDDHSRCLVHLGTEPGCKAYRPLDLSKRKIVVSSDLVINKNKSWSWDTEEQREEGNSGTFELELKRFNDNEGPMETRVVEDNESIIPDDEIEEEENVEAGGGSISCTTKEINKNKQQTFVPRRLHPPS